jgi:6-pyruvoyltetrahydropterin/6-carboxytetrahydropterin synthase
MFEVGVTGQFEAAHRLRGNFGPATRRHGHTYRVEVSVRGHTLRPDGTLFDISRLQDAVADVTGALHYQDLDELPQFANTNTTAESLAHHLFQQIAARVAGRDVAWLGVRLWESPDAYASYDEEFA